MTRPVQSAIDRSFPALEIRRLSGHIGGEVQNFRLSPDLDDSLLASLKRALLYYKVLFFRDQTGLDDARHQALGRRFGTIEAHPTVPAPAGTAFFELDASTGGGRADSWHTDVTFVAEFPKICLLRGVTIPAYGGDTVWANTARAYETLPASLKSLADSLWALHSNEFDYGNQRSDLSEARKRHYREVFISTRYQTEHPVVHVHPETGERSLLLGHFIRNFIGLSSSETRKILEVLQDRATRLENSVRWSWRPDDVAIWDNRSTIHFAVNDYGDQPRVVRRVTVHGEAAIGIDGRRSRIIVAPDEALSIAP